MERTPRHVRDIPVNWDWIAAETAGSLASSMPPFATFDDQEQRPAAELVAELQAAWVAADVGLELVELDDNPTPVTA